ncbi:S41 family peptidase [Deinococcus cavernae]|uniref:S41 family peptidase n=1 Tax=Deinococcus cavernae TaxID=2320857 RepID=A0A418V9P3_9DEIO|nr:S41 family peptidase [Deinococcus cavernae]RJF72777.1 S41 family peptidase [Deinococcus cavernae]
MNPVAVSRKNRRPLTGWLSTTLASAALLLLPATHAQPLTSPAQQLFDQVNQIVQQNYGGLSTVDRSALASEYQTRLDNVCAAIKTTCPAEKAYPVIQAQISALGDEHSFFQTPEDFEDFLTTATGGERRQFGVKLAELDGQNRVVLEVIPESAAEAAGLRRGDLIQTLDSQPYRYEVLRQARLDGRTIRLGIDRQGQRLDITLTPKASSTRDLPRLTYTGPGNQIGVLRIPTFLAGGGVGQRVHDLVHEAQAHNAKGLVIDLRGDTGGSLTECDSAVSAFVPTFTRIARTSDGDLRTRVRGGVRLEDTRPPSSIRNAALWTGPVAVLVDRNSASCSEFFAFEVQYRKRGPVIGEETAGVGNTATRVFELLNSAALQLTITNYVKPDGTPYPTRITPNPLRAFTEDDTRRLTRGEDTGLSLALSALASAPSLSTDDLN